MRHLIALLLAAPMLAGCVNMLAERQAYFSQFIGRTEADLVRDLGVPTRSFDTDGRHFLAYTQQTTQVIPAIMPAYGWGAYGGWYGAYPAGVILRVCETTFEIADNKVVTFTLRGDSCAW